MANTPNLGLHQWAAGDAFLREDFNADFLKLDGLTRCATAAYVGDGKDNRAFSLGFRPKAVWLFGNSKGRTCTGVVTATAAFRSMNSNSSMGEGEMLEVVGNTYYAGITGDGFILYANSFYNTSPYKYFYIAIG